MDDNIKIQKHDLPTWMTTSKIEKHCIQIQEARSERKKNMPIHLHFTITYVYSTFSQVHILLIVVRCAAQNIFGILLNP